ncbi:MAG: O-antigen ligase family protein [Thermoguttaceae bacterium]
MQSLFSNRFWFGDESHNFSGFFATAGLRIALVLPFFVCISHSFRSGIEIALLLCWFLEGRWSEKWRTIRQSPIQLAFATLVGVLAFSIFYSPDLWQNGTTGWKNCVKGLFSTHPFLIILVLSWYLKKVLNRDRILFFLHLTLLFTLLLAIYRCYWIPAFYYGGERADWPIYFKNTIGFGIMLTLLGSLWFAFPYTFRRLPLFRYCLTAEFRRDLNVASSLKALFFGNVFSANSYTNNLFFAIGNRVFFVFLRLGMLAGIYYCLFWINPSRTAQLAFLISICAVIAWRFRIVGMIILAGMLTLLVFIPYQTSSTFHSKTHRAINELTSAQTALETGDTPPEYERAALYLDCFREFQQRPIVFGYGINQGSVMASNVSQGIIPHTHCEFLNIFFQAGWFGLTIYTALFGVLFHQALFRHSRTSALLIFVATTLLIDSFVSNAFTANTSSRVYVILFAVLAAEKYTSCGHKSDSSGHIL